MLCCSSPDVRAPTPAEQLVALHLLAGHYSLAQGRARPRKCQAILWPISCHNDQVDSVLERVGKSLILLQ